MTLVRNITDRNTAIERLALILCQADQRMHGHPESPDLTEVEGAEQYRVLAGAVVAELEAAA